MKSVAIGLATIAAAALLGGCGGSSRQASVDVPNLIGKNSVRAQALLTRQGLRWRWEDGAKPRPTNGFLMADTIEGQSPAPGQHVKRGTVVMLVPGSDKRLAPPLG